MKKGFNFNGTKPDNPDTKDVDESGSYKIKNVNFPGTKGNNSPEPGGMVEFAQNCTFTNIDIVNSRIWRTLYSTDFLQTDESGKKISGIKIGKNTQGYVNSGVGGTFVGLAVDCTFTNARAYIDDTDRLPSCSSTTFHTNSSVVGGLVGIAIGSSSNSSGCSFTNCAASYIIADTSYDRLANKLVYGGGLIGMTIGNVTIDSCYGASQLSAYYSGGLVGATISNEEVECDFGVLGETGTKKFKGTTTIKNSFAAGQINKQVRVGGGLIADIQGDAPSVTGCYSSTWWQIIPPIAYGTFKGDKANYYIYQTQIATLVTSNVEAWFSTNNIDVLSLQNKNGEINGTPCSKESLYTALKNNSSWNTDTKNTGTPVASADHWFYNNGLIDANKGKNYPFPMPTSNTKFFGDWIQTGRYSESGEPTSAGTSPNFAFEGYYAVYYCDEDGSQHADANQAMSRSPEIPNSLKFKIYKDNNKNSFGFEDAGGWWLHDDNHSKFELVYSKDSEGNEKPLAYKSKDNCWWARRVENGGNFHINSFKGANEFAGKTDISVSDDGTSFIFSAPKYYDPNYNPLTGYGYKINITDTVKINIGNEEKPSYIDVGFTENTRVYWDYYGFFCTTDINQSYYERCYIKLGNVESAKYDEESRTITVNEKAFKNKINIRKILHCRPTR